MSLDDRLRDGLEGLHGIQGSPPDSIVDAVVGRGRRYRWTRRVAAGAMALAAAVAALAVGPMAFDALRSVSERRPAVPAGGRGLIKTVVGTGIPMSSGDGGPATKAAIEYPVDLGFDGEGNLYILEHGSIPRVRKVDPSGLITTVVGPEAGGEASRLDLATTFSPTGLAVDAEGNVYLGGGDGPDIENRAIRVDPSGHVSTIAGTGQPGFSGDGGPATEAELQNVWDVAVDPEGALYIAGNNRIRKVDAHGVITTIVGAGTKGFSGDGGPAVEAQTNHISGVTADGFGNIYFIDYWNGRIRRIDTDGTITTIAGSRTSIGEDCFSGDAVPATQATFCGPEHLSVDSDGNVYVADTYSHRIRMIDTNGIVRTIAGSGMDGYSGDGGPALEASLSETSSVAVGPDGGVYIADSANDRVRKVVT